MQVSRRGPIFIEYLSTEYQTKTDALAAYMEFRVSRDSHMKKN